MKLNYIKSLVLAIIAGMVVLACSEDPERANYISFEGKTAELAAPIPSSGSLDVKVYTTGATGTFDLVVDTDATTTDPANYTVPGTVSVTSGNVGTFTVQATPGLADTQIVLKLKSDGSILVGDPITIDVVGLCENPNLLIDFVFDTYSEETYWAITDVDGNVLKSVEANAYADYSNGSFTEGLCFPSGNYKFTVYDAWGDGFPGGSATLKLSDNTVLGVIDGASFSSVSATIDFTVP